MTRQSVLRNAHRVTGPPAWQMDVCSLKPGRYVPRIAARQDRKSLRFGLTVVDEYFANQLKAAFPHGEQVKPGRYPRRRKAQGVLPGFHADERVVVEYLRPFFFQRGHVAALAGGKHVQRTGVPRVARQGDGLLALGRPAGRVAEPFRLPDHLDDKARRSQSFMVTANFGLPLKRFPPGMTARGGCAAIPICLANNVLTG